MFIRLRSQAGLFDLIPQAFSVSVTDGTRLTFADTDSAARFLAQFRDDALAMARLKDLHDHIGTIARVSDRLDDDALIPRQLYYTIGTLHLPLCRNITPDDPEPSADLITALPSGWLYVYLNGYLWREVQVERHAGALRDVDLAAHPGKHPRPATGPWFELLLVPHK
ncbi:MAG: hypothetical protein GXP08_05510, partial [Gammaproteobacteria bacterium]|nr:hypothetical protein [Gammaproteobacteria bacterium]